jgi:hypothetical protein
MESLELIVVAVAAVAHALGYRLSRVRLVQHRNTAWPTP